MRTKKHNADIYPKHHQQGPLIVESIKKIKTEHRESWVTTFYVSVFSTAFYPVTHSIINQSL